MSIANARKIAETIVTDVSHGEGGSIDLYGERPTRGYMVGGYSWTLTATPENFDTYTVMDFLSAHASMLSWDGVYVGWWEHKGHIYLDMSKNIQGHAKAVEEGRLNKEIAIWSLDTNSEISLDKVK